jgi:hypothetical protein
VGKDRVMKYEDILKRHQLREKELEKKATSDRGGRSK